jgi:hypothetical protein
LKVETAQTTNTATKIATPSIQAVPIDVRNTDVAVVFLHDFVDDNGRHTRHQQNPQHRVFEHLAKDLAYCSEGLFLSRVRAVLLAAERDVFGPDSTLRVCIDHSHNRLKAYRFY